MPEELYGPRTSFGRIIHKMKYRGPEETFDDYCVRYARTTADNEFHFRRLLRYLRTQLLLPAGRQQLSVGRPYQTTGFNCFIGPVIGDNTQDIFDAVKFGALTMRAGGGIGWDFSSIRPNGEPIRGLGLGATASGPVSFMNVFNAMCATIMSAGERRGAMMGVLRIDHPDILRFINAKKDQTSLTNFNISVALTDDFVEALEIDGLYDLKFNNIKFGSVRAQDVWAVLMENNWDYAEPGVLFIDRINKLNPLYYCETISACNPCAEQNMPPNSCCLLASLNITKLLTTQHSNDGPRLAVQSGKQLVKYDIDYELLEDAVDAIVRACDNVIDRTVYPLPEHKEEELSKRRMGIGVAGMANALEIMGFSYGSQDYLEQQSRVLQRIQLQAYMTSIELSKEKGSFPLFDAEKYCSGEYIKNNLPQEYIDLIKRYGLRNGLLTSIAPTGTISLAADNISSGIEPVFNTSVKRDILTPDGKQTFDIEDYAYAFYGVKGKAAENVSGKEHIDVLCNAQKYIDNSISKTCNVTGQISGQGPGMSFNEFKDLYLYAYNNGAKSCTTFNVNGKRMGILQAKSEDKELVCTYDPETGTKTCEA